MGLLRYCGKQMESAMLCEDILKNKRFLENGGVTFSGGEPLAQSEFLFACLEQLDGQLHRAIQTSGYCAPEIFARALELTDYMLFDLKLADDQLHRKFTGVSNRSIHQNLKNLALSGKEFVVRIPLIPGVTDTDENITGIVRLLQENQITYAELLPYTQMAGGKYAMVGREYSPGFDDSRAVCVPERIFEENGIDFTVL